MNHEERADADRSGGAFAPGQQVVLRSIRDFGRRGRAVGFAVAGSVIADDPEGVVVVATAPESEMRTRAGVGSGPGGRIVLPDDWDGTHDERTWQGHTVVRVHRAGEPWSVWRWHDGDAWTSDWYGNLESPWTRTRIGFDTQDWILDVVCSGTPGSDTWSVRYKDEDEFAWLHEQGVITSAKVDRAKDAGARLTEIARTAEWPFNADWSPWLPDRNLPAAALPADWKSLHESDTP